MRHSINERSVLFFEGFLGGILVFLCIYGFQVLDVRYDAWLLNGGDISQNYIGWQYFRETPWQFPWGLIDGLTYPEKVSVIFTDSITVFAFIFKILSPLLPKTFQYFGIWGIVSFGLMGGLSSLLINKYTKNKFICCMASLFFVLSPYVLQRMYAHTSLGGQWIIILAIYAWTNFVGNNIKKRTLIWCGIIGLASMIHIYFVPMTLVFCFFASLDYCISLKGCIRLKIKLFMVHFLIPILSTLLLLFSAGAFYGSGALEDEGLGYFSANLNFLINPIMGISNFFVARKCGSGQYEGLGYLGAGIIGLAVISFFLAQNNNWKYHEKKILKEKKIVMGIVASVFFLILALSPTVMLGEDVLFEIPWPDFLIKMLSIFRSSGRFVWPICYLVMLVCFVSILCYANKRTARVVICAALILQVYDLSDNMREKHEKFFYRQEWIPSIAIQDWNSLLNGKKEIVFVPYDLVFEEANITFSITELAYQKNIMLNSFYVSRINTSAICSRIDETLRELKEGKAKDEVLYIFPSYAEVWQEEYGLEFYSVNNLCIGSKQIIEELEAKHADPDMLKVDMADLHVTGEADTEGPLVIQKDRVMFGPYYPLKKGSYILQIYGEHLDEIGLMLLGDDGELINSRLKINTENMVEIDFDLLHDVNEFQVQIFNSTDNVRTVNSVVISK